MTAHRIPLAYGAVLAAALTLGSCSLPSSSGPTDSARLAAMYDELDAEVIEVVREQAPDFTRDLDDDEVLAVLHNSCDEGDAVDTLLASGATLEEAGTLLGAAAGAYC